MSSVEEINDHTLQAISRYVTALKNKPRVIALTASIVDQVQEVETVLFELLKERSITNDFDGEEAIGIQLDNLGKVIGLSRYTEQTDDSYRADLRVWVRFLLSQGEASTLIFVLKALTDSDDVKLAEHFPGHVIMYFSGTVYNEENLASLMNKCAAAGIRIDLVEKPEGAFTFDCGPGYDIGLYSRVLSQH